MKISPMGAELFHADRHKESNSRFSQFCEHAYRIVVVVVVVGVGVKLDNQHWYDHVPNSVR
jgi:hypothetical protein